MRFFRRRVWRVIPELDALPDDRARAFVRATRNLRAWRAARWILITLLLFPSMWLYMGLVALVAMAFHTRLDDYMDDARRPVVLKVLLIAGLVLSPLVGWLMVSRWMTLQAVRSALTRRARCEGCGYALAGLPVGEQDRVRCPECGREVAAERGLGEVRVIDGRGTFEPPLRSFRWQLSRAAAWKWSKRCAITAGVLFLAAGSWFGWSEWELRSDAATATADRTGVAPLSQMWLALQPASSSPEEANAWIEFEAARVLIARVNGEVWAFPGADPDLRPDYDALDNTLRDATPEQTAEYDASRALAERMLPPLERAGVFEAWRRMRAAPRREIRLFLPAGEPAVSLLTPELAQVREAARMNKARMVVAAREGRLEEFCDALQTTTALAGMSAEYPSIVGSLVACAVDSLAFRQVRGVLAGHPSAVWLDAMDAAMIPDRPRPPRSYGLEADRRMVMDTLAYAFANQKLMRRHRWQSWFGDDKGRRMPVGRYAENKALLDGPMSAVVGAADVERHERPLLPEVAAPYVMVELLNPRNAKALSSQDQVELERRGLKIMMALERYRLAHGRVPATLKELTPEFLSSLPLDPWSGRPLGYRRLSDDEASADPQRREYLLWGVGGDGVDNGGRVVENPADRYGVIATKKFTGFDFVINDSDR